MLDRIKNLEPFTKVMLSVAIVLISIIVFSGPEVNEPSIEKGIALLEGPDGGQASMIIGEAITLDPNLSDADLLYVVVRFVDFRREFWRQHPEEAEAYGIVNGVARREPSDSAEDDFNE